MQAHLRCEVDSKSTVEVLFSFKHTYFVAPKIQWKSLV